MAKEPIAPVLKKAIFLLLLGSFAAFGGVYGGPRESLGAQTPRPWGVSSPKAAGNRLVADLAQRGLWVDAPSGSLGQSLAQRSRPAAGRAARVVRLKVTAYCPCPICCGNDADGITACGKSVRANGGRFVATAGAVPMGAFVSVPGYYGSQPVPVYDRLGPGPANRLDVYFPTHRQAKQWGVRYLDVVVYR